MVSRRMVCVLYAPPLIRSFDHLERKVFSVKIGWPYCTEHVHFRSSCSEIGKTLDDEGFVDAKADQIISRG
jgi:hypothetical protein